MWLYGEWWQPTKTQLLITSYNSTYGQGGWKKPADVNHHPTSPSLWTSSAAIRDFPLPFLWWPSFSPWFSGCVFSPLILNLSNICHRKYQPQVPLPVALETQMVVFLPNYVWFPWPHSSKASLEWMRPDLWRPRVWMSSPWLGFIWLGAHHCTSFHPKKTGGHSNIAGKFQLLGGTSWPNGLTSSDVPSDHPRSTEINRPLFHSMALSETCHYPKSREKAPNV